MNKRRSNLLFYLILNIIVSAATTLAVLMIWDRTRGLDLPTADPALATQVAAEQAKAAPPPVEVLPTATNPPSDEAVIQIVSVIGAGDLNQEVVLLKRVGEGNLRLTGWSLRGSGGSGRAGSVFTFPEQPELVLYKDGAVQVYTKPGTDSATDIFWNRTEAAWGKGETIQVVDNEGVERASYSIP